MQSQSDIKTSLHALNLERVFYMYTKYRYKTFNNILGSQNQICKFKEKAANIKKIFGDTSASKSISQAKNEGIMVFVKENKKTKVYVDEGEEGRSGSKLTNKSSSDMSLETAMSKIKENQSKKEEEFSSKNLSNKTFVVLGGYPDIVQAIAKRGLKQIFNAEERSYDFLYTLKNADIPFEQLNPDQLVNHYWKANEITRKAGLLRNLRQLYFMGVNIDNFYPRAYDLGNKEDLEDFCEDFKTSRAVAILKQTKERGGQGVNKKVVETAVAILER